MSVFRRFRKQPTERPSAPAGVAEAAKEYQAAGFASSKIVAQLDRAIQMQDGTIRKWVERQRKRNPDATPQQTQEILDKQFLRIVTGTGGSAGAAAAVPGIGLVTGALAMGAESLAFLDAAAVYTVASSYLRGADISDEEHRKFLVLICLLGSRGTAIVDTFVPQQADGKRGPGASPMAWKSAMRHFSPTALTEVNNRMVKIMLKTATRKLKWAWLGKLLPFGVGMVLGSAANRKLAKRVIENTQEVLGPAKA